MNNIIMGNFFRSKRPQKNSKKRTSKRNISPQRYSYFHYFCRLKTLNNMTKVYRYIKYMNRSYRYGRVQCYECVPSSHKYVTGYVQSI